MKKGLLHRIVICFLALARLCSYTVAEEQPGLWFEVSNNESEYTIFVELGGAAGPEMLQFCLRYDVERMKLRSATAGEVFRETTAPTISAGDPGRIYLVWDALKPLPDGTLLVLRFTVRENADGNAVFFFDEEYEMIAADGNFNQIPLHTEELEISVGEAAIEVDSTPFPEDTSKMIQTEEPGAQKEEASVQTPDPLPVLTPNMTCAPSASEEVLAVSDEVSASSPETVLNPTPETVSHKEELTQGEIGAAEQQSTSESPAQYSAEITVSGEEQMNRTGYSPLFVIAGTGLALILAVIWVCFGRRSRMK